MSIMSIDFHLNRGFQYVSMVFLQVFLVSKPPGPLPVWVQCREVMGEPSDQDAMACAAGSLPKLLPEISWVAIQRVICQASCSVT